MTHTSRTVLWAALAALGFLAWALPASAQEAAAPGPSAAELHAETGRAFGRGDYAAAEAALRRLAEIEPDNFVVHYNLACALAMQGDAAGAGESLKRAVEKGFVDYYHLTRDGHLARAREGEAYRALVEHWPRILEAHLEANLELARTFFGPKLSVTREERLRVAYASAFDPGSFESARAELERLYDWGIAEVFTDLADESKAPYDAWVVVVLPDRRGFLKWAVAEYGQSAVTGLSGIGGAYDHDAKRLVAQDLGGTLRHEFFHILHWRSATRLGQAHPVWIQEGLCSLVEDFEVGGDGSLRPTPSWRTNTVKRLLSAGKLPRIEQLASMPRERFTGVRPLSNYAQARAVFLYLWERGKLGAWYRAYTEGYREDPTGVAALVEVLGMSAAEIEEDYRGWVRALPEVAEQIRPGMAGLGAEVDAGAGDGPVIASLDRRSPARAAGLRAGDVITSIDGKPTRDLNELVRVLGEYEVGDEVEVGYRRRARHGVATVTLTTR